MSTTPQYASTPVVKVSEVTTANAQRNGTGAIVDGIIGGTNGTRIDKIFIKRFTTSASGSVLNIFIRDPATNAWGFVADVPLGPSANSTTAPQLGTVISSTDPNSILPIVLPFNAKIGYSVTVADNITVTTFGGNF